jgi:hypothetical protein
MYSDARSDREHMTSSSEARQRAEVALALALDESPRVTNPATRAALHAFVDALSAEGSMPEAVVIAFKHLLMHSHSLHRYDSETRVELRAALISECIACYFGEQVTADTLPPRPKLTVIRGREHGEPRTAAERPPDAGA